MIRSSDYGIFEPLPTFSKYPEQDVTFRGKGAFIKRTAVLPFGQFNVGLLYGRKYLLYHRDYSGAYLL